MATGHRISGHRLAQIAPMDNNAAERGIRTFCLGKKNWYTIDTTSGARASAIHYSIAESARANNLKSYEYFKYLLEEAKPIMDI